MSNIDHIHIDYNHKPLNTGVRRTFQQWPHENIFVQLHQRFTVNGVWLPLVPTRNPFPHPLNKRLIVLFYMLSDSILTNVELNFRGCRGSAVNEFLGYHIQ